MNTIRLIIADDHQIFRQGLKLILEDDQNIEIIGEASNGKEAVEMVKAEQPDVVMLDISMPILNGLEATAIIDKQHKKTKPLILSMHNNEDYISKSIENGALGYLLKDASKEEILKAIHTVAEGGRYFGNSVSDIIIQNYVKKSKNKGIDQSSNQHKEPILSKTEKEILKLIIDGLSSREIAEKLGSSVRTIDNHRANMMKKNKVKNAAELVKLAIENKWV
jgi:two-component system response regulator DegU